MIAMVRAIHTTFVSPRGMNCPYTTLGTTLCTRHMKAMVGTRSRSLHTLGRVPCPLDDVVLQACGSDAGWR